MNVILRPATKLDTDFARKAHHEAYYNVVVEQFGTWNEAVQDRFFDAAWDNPGFEIILCDDTPCGFVRTEDLPDKIYLHELVLLPEFQGKGIGTFILHRLMKDAHSRNVPIELQVLQANSAAELYKKLGFREIDRTEAHIQMRWEPSQFSIKASGMLNWK